MMIRIVVAAGAACLILGSAFSAPRTLREIVADYNFDESKIVPYELPDPLVQADGTRVVSAQQWERVRRPEILNLLAENEYGWPLPPPTSVAYETLSEKTNSLALRREVKMTFTGPTGRRLSATLLIYIPNGGDKKPAPVFLGLNFLGNHACTLADDVALATVDLSRQEARYVPLRPKKYTTDWPAPRGKQARRWPFAEILRRGYAVGTVSYSDFFPDVMGAAANSALALFLNDAELAGPQVKYTPIGAWAWGLSRMLDYCATEPRIDAACAAVIGHSRLGKTALWAGAVDARFKLVCANDSGCGGGALHKRKIGENIEALLSHRASGAAADWFTEKFAGYVGHEERLPFDQHELLALIAPRALAIGVATKDRSADPKGEFAAVLAAKDVWRLYGENATSLTEMPPPDTGDVAPISFHVREGRHDIVLFDWQEYLDAADRAFGMDSAAARGARYWRTKAEADREAWMAALDAEGHDFSKRHRADCGPRGIYKFNRAVKLACFTITKEISERLGKDVFDEMTAEGPVHFEWRRLPDGAVDYSYTAPTNWEVFVRAYKSKPKMNPKPEANIHFRTSLPSKGTLALTFMHHREDWVAGPYANCPFPTNEIRSANNFAYAARTALTLLGLDRPDAFFGKFWLGTFDSNFPNGHTDFPPHFHIIGSCRDGQQTHHYYVRHEDGRITSDCYQDMSNVIDVWDRAVEFKPGDEFPYFDGKGRVALRVKILADGTGLELMSPDRVRRVRIAGTRPCDGVAVEQWKDGRWRKVEDVAVEDDPAAGLLKTPEGTLRYDPKTGKVYGDKK